MVVKDESSKGGKTFTLLNIDTATIITCDDMKMTIKKQLNEDAQQKQNCSYNNKTF